MSSWPEVSTPSSELKLSREKKEVARREFLSLCKEKDARRKEVKAHAACAFCELCLKLDSLSEKALDLVRSKLQLFQISYEVEMRSKNTNSCCGSSCTKCPPQTPNSIMSSLREGPRRVPTGICVSWTQFVCTCLHVCWQPMGSDFAWEKISPYIQHEVSLPAHSKGQMHLNLHTWRQFCLGSGTANPDQQPWTWNPHTAGSGPLGRGNALKNQAILWV